MGFLYAAVSIVASLIFFVLVLHQFLIPIHRENRKIMHLSPGDDIIVDGNRYMALKRQDVHRDNVRAIIQERIVAGTLVPNPKAFRSVSALLLDRNNSSGWYKVDVTSEAYNKTDNTLALTSKTSYLIEASDFNQASSKAIKTAEKFKNSDESSLVWVIKGAGEPYQIGQLKDEAILFSETI